MLAPRFHPVVREWFASTLGEPTPAQVRGWAAIDDRPPHADCGADRLGQDARGVPDRDRRAVAGGARRRRCRTKCGSLYVSPLKALSADIHKNLAEPRRGIARLAAAAGLARAARSPPRCAPATRRRPSARRCCGAAAHPGHDAGVAVSPAHRRRAAAQMLRTVRTVIVDEIHAVIGTRRGAHLALSLERLEHIVERPLLRHRPLGDAEADRGGRALPRRRPRGGPCAIVDEGHRARRWTWRSRCRARTLDAVMSHEVWEEYYDRLASSIAGAPHHADLREHAAARGADGAPPERAARRGSGHRASRQPVEGEAARRRRAAARPASSRRSSRPRRSSSASTSATSISSARSARRIASRRCSSASAARATRCAGTPKGRVFPVTRDDLVECAALLRAVRRGELDRDRARTTRRSTCSRSRSSPRPRARRVRRGRAVRAGAARLAVSRRSTRGDFDAVVAHAGRRLRHAARPARGAAASRRSATARCAAGAARGCWRSPPAARSPRWPTTASCSSRTTRSSARSNEDFAIESTAGRRVPARQRVVAHPAGRRRHRARRRRAGRAADDPVLARRSAGAQRRAVARGVASCARTSMRCCPASAATQTQLGGDWRGCERDRPARGRRRRRSSATSPRARARSASCRRRRRSCSSASSTSRAACSWCCTRRSAAASTARGAWRCASASAAVQLRAAGGGDRGRLSSRSGRSTRSRSPTCSATCIPRPTRDVAGAGVPRRAGVRDALALEHDDRARGAAQPRRPQGARRSCSACSPTT